MLTPNEPSDPRTGSRSSMGWTIAALLLAWATFTYWTTARRDFWGDELRDAVVAREVSSTPLGEPGGWLFPRVHEEPRLVVPPLLPALAAGVQAISGLEPRLAYRLPVLLIAVLGLWTTLALGRSLFGRRVGLLAMAIQATTGLWFFEATWLHRELAFAVLVQVAISAFAIVALEPGRRAWRLGGWLALAGASLVVSPIAAIAAAFLPLGAFYFFSGGLVAVRRGISRLTARGAWLAFVLPVAPWYVLAGVFHGRALIEQHVVGLHSAAFSPPVGSSGPIWFYVLAILLAFLPWTVLLPAGLLHSKGRLDRPGPRLLTVWFFVTLALLSLLPYKDVSFLLLLWSPAALAIAASLLDTGEKMSVWEGYLESAGHQGLYWMLRVPAFLTALLAALWLTETGARLPESILTEMGEHETLVRTVLISLAVASALGWVIGERVRRLGGSDQAFRKVLEAARGTLIVLLGAGFVMPTLDPVVSARGFLDRVQEVTAGVPVRTYGRRRPDEVAYFIAPGVPHIDEPILDPPEHPGERLPQDVLASFLGADTTVYLIASEAEVENLRTQFPVFRSRLHATSVTGRLHGLGRCRLWSNREPPAKLAPGSETGEETGEEAGTAEPSAGTPPAPEETGAPPAPGETETPPERKGEAGT